MQRADQVFSSDSKKPTHATFSLLSAFNNYDCRNDLKMTFLKYCDFVSLARTATRSKAMHSLSCVFFKHTKERNGDDIARQLILAADVLLSEIVLKKEKDTTKKYYNDNTFNFFQKLHQAFVMANDIKLKHQIVDDYKSYFEKYSHYLTVEKDKIQIQLFGIRLWSVSGFLEDPELGSYYSRRETSSNHLQRLFDAATQVELRQLICSEALFIMKRYFDNIPVFTGKNIERQHQEYLKHMNELLTKWQNLSTLTQAELNPLPPVTNRKNGCVIS